MANEIEPRPVKPYCTCETPFGCVIHDPNLDGLSTIEGLPPEAVLAVVLAANKVAAQLQHANGEVYAIDCAIAEDLERALRKLAMCRP